MDDNTYVDLGSEVLLRLEAGISSEFKIPSEQPRWPEIQEASLYSAAISLKRIADLLEKLVAEDEDTEKCAGCGVPFGGEELSHVDTYHRFTPLCGACYSDPDTAKRTASDPDDPNSWWNKK